MSTSLRILFTIWALLALFALYPVTQSLGGSFPFLTIIWIIVPSFVVWRSKDTGKVGFRVVSWRLLISTTAINLCGLLFLMLLFEPWSHTYLRLIGLAISSATPDTTFAWLLRLPRIPALIAMTFYSGLVTLFGEELFFRGWILQALRKRMRTVWAILIQSILFVLPNLLVAFALPALQGWLYGVVYTWLGIGILGGWAASRTNSIWPSLISATLSNLVLVAFLF